MSKEKILLVDDDIMFRETIRSILQTLNCDIVEASNGEEAKNILALNEFNLVLSDVKMPKMNGIELLHYVKKSYDIPVVLMTGFSDIIEMQEAHEIGANDFLKKPFEKEALLNIIKKYIQKNIVKESNEDKDDQFCKIGIDDLVSGNNAQFNIYVRLSKMKYVMVASKGDGIDNERIENYKSKGIEYLHILKADFGDYVGFTLDLAEKVVDSKKINAEKKKKFILQTGEIILESVYVAGISEDSFSEAKSFVELTLSVLTKNNNVFELLSYLSEHTDFLYAHSLAVSTYSIMFAKKIGWNSPKSLMLVSAGGLFHDIGKSQIDKLILEKKENDLTEDEVKEVMAHPVKGADILTDTKSFPKEVVQIVIQHHEECTGEGYPFGVSKQQIYPLARLIFIVDKFCNLVVKNPKQQTPLTPANAILEMEKKYIDKMDMKLFTYFKNLIND